MSDLMKMIEKTKKIKKTDNELLKAGKMPSKQEMEIETPEYKKEIEIKTTPYKPMNVKATPSPHTPVDFKTPTLKAGIPSQKPMKDLSSLAPLVLKLESAKIKPSKQKEDEEINAVTSDLEYFNVPRNKQGKFIQTGREREEYLRSIGKLKSRKLKNKGK